MTDEQLERARRIVRFMEYDDPTPGSPTHQDLQTIKALLDERDRLREALEWYADEADYDDSLTEDFLLVDHAIENDRGERARTAIHPEGVKE